MCFDGSGSGHSNPCHGRRNAAPLISCHKGNCFPVSKSICGGSVNRCCDGRKHHHRSHGCCGSSSNW